MTEIEEVQNKVDWGQFESKYLRIEDNEPVDVELTNLRQTIEEYQGQQNPGIRMDVLTLNGEKTEKVLKTTSKRLATALKPFFLEAEKNNTKTVRVRISKNGSGLSTKYFVKPL